jgi:hypothetical protein
VTHVPTQGAHEETVLVSCVLATPRQCTAHRAGWELVTVLQWPSLFLAAKMTSAEKLRRTGASHLLPPPGKSNMASQLDMLLA